MGIFDLFKKKATVPNIKKDVHINTKEELTFPLGYKITFIDKSDKNAYKVWIKKYDQKRKSEIVNGFAIDGNYGQKLSASEKRVVEEFNIIFSDYLNLSKSCEKTTLMHDFLSKWHVFNNSRSIKISKSYFIWCCDIISLTNDQALKSK